jgi:photosystem II stability/assembly factor-like uncharacterized protein
MTQTQAVNEIRDFSLVSNTEGWTLVGNHLYWTSNHGTSWSEITPALPLTATVYAVSFLDAEQGWVLWSDLGADGSLVLQIEHTYDRGGKWNNRVTQTLMPDDPVADIENASMDWIDASTGWVSAKQKTGSNFSSGILFRTEDGGQTWQRLTLPIGEPVHFVNNRVGWVAGGPARDQLFKTRDGGNTWEEQPIPNAIVSGQIYSLYAPLFDSHENGLLAVQVLKGEDFQLDFYSSVDGGQSWRLVTSLPLGSQVGRPPLSLLDVQNLAAVMPNSERIIQVVDGEQRMVTNQDGMSTGIVDLKMRTSDFGWAKWNMADCNKQVVADGSTSISCTSTTKLIETQNSGITWESLALPGNVPDTFTQSYQKSFSDLAKADEVYLGKTLLVVGQGFDICTIPTITQLQAWWNDSPYKSVNLYIGGVARACPNPALTAAYVNQMRAQGWTFIPTWVGPQAPCTTFIKRFSADVSAAYIDGVNEANLAVASLAALGLTYADRTGSVVYYDMEIYGNDKACREAVNAFVNGWVTHMHDLGNLAGVYGATGVYYYPTGCTSGLGDYLTIPNIPDVIWPARWYLPAPDGTYDPTASVWDIGSCIPTTAWANHQRIRQYAGDHYETWGGVTLYGIDSNVLDGVGAAQFFAVSNFYASPARGHSPLTVTFYIEKMDTLISCNWDYGDGQTGTSCAVSHTHTYVNDGKYTVSLLASGPNGSDSLMRSNYITVSPYQVYIPLINQK